MRRVAVPQSWYMYLVMNGTATRRTDMECLFPWAFTHGYKRLSATRFVPDAGERFFAPTAWLDRAAVGAYCIRPKNQAGGVIPGERFFAPTRDARGIDTMYRRRGEKSFAPRPA
jgi:hypothetical protein